MVPPMAKTLATDRQQTFVPLSDIPAMFGTVGQGYFVLRVG